RHERPGGRGQRVHHFPRRGADAHRLGVGRRRGGGGGPRRPAGNLPGVRTAVRGGTAGVDVQNQGAAADTPLAAAAGERRPVIEARGLTKRYGRHTAVAGLDLTIYEGEVFGLLGPNGAGKTTTILMLLGLTEPTAGSVRVLGWDPARDPIEVKRAVGYLPENIGFYDDMTGRENLLYTARLNGLPERDAQERIDSLLTAVGLEGAGDRLVRVYSRGMRQRLGLADVLVKRPRMIILDEPTLGIDPAGI